METNNNNTITEIKEDILIIGGGPIGGFLAHVFATRHNFSVRIIERL